MLKHDQKNNRTENNILSKECIACGLEELKRWNISKTNAFATCANQGQLKIET